MMIKINPSLLKGQITASPSKSYTHRAVILASLCNGKSKIENPLLSRDILATIESCKSLGATISVEKSMIIEGKMPLKVPDNIIDVSNSGTTLRLVSSMSALTLKGYSIFSGDDSIRNRPMQPLLDALHSLGVRCWSTRLNGCAPLIIEGGGILGGSTTISGLISSQFLSSLLISAPLAQKKTLIKLSDKLVSRPYVDATLKVIQHFGGKIIEDNDGAFKIPPLQNYTSQSFNVPGDFSSASFILAGAALSDSEISVNGLNFQLPQGDESIINILKQMGAILTVNTDKGEVIVQGTKTLLGGKFNLSNSPDLLPVLAILACKCKDEVVIHGVKHARFKETDRIAVLAKELPKLGVSIEELEDGLKIRGTNNLKQCTLNAYGDHRMAMAFTIIGLASQEGCKIIGFESVDISYPKFEEDIHSLGGKLEEVDN
ncbi:3-phosphoshikimate 1-carboxyvinyltransferase [Thermoproteota archaeon]